MKQWLWLCVLTAVLTDPVLAQSEKLLSANSSVHVVTAGEPEETGDYTLDARGNINMLYANSTHLAGLSAPAVQAKIDRSLKKFYVSPQVSLTLVSAGAYPHHRRRPAAGGVPD